MQHLIDERHVALAKHRTIHLRYYSYARINLGAMRAP
jgi:hypothetical protein